MLDLADTFNAGFPDLGYEPLPEHEVAARAGQVWKDLQSGKIERLHGKRATCRTDADEVRHLAAAARNGSDAHLLLTLLRCEHGGRSRRGEGFAINANAMSVARTLGDWSPARIRAARDVLLKEGYIEVTRAGTSHRGGRLPTLYRLLDRELTPSILQTLRAGRSGRTEWPAAGTRSRST